MCCISLLDLVLADRVADIGWCRERYYSPCSTRFNMVVYQALSVRHSFIFAVAPWNRVTSRGGVLRFQRTDAKRTEIGTVGSHRALLIPPIERILIQLIFMELKKQRVIVLHPTPSKSACGRGAL